MDVVLVENLGIGIDPTVTYSFYLYTQYCYTRGDKKRFIYSFHDFVQQRPVNFMNIKKIHHPRFGVVPNWHSVLYPAYPNIWNSPDFVDTFFRCRGSFQGVVGYPPAPGNATTTPSRATLLTSTPSFHAQAAFRPLRRSYSTGDRYPRLECNLTRL